MDPAIKLFGTTIPLAEEEEEEPEIKEPEPAASPTEEQKETSKELANMEVNNDSATTTDEENGRVQISSSYFISNSDNECKTSIAYEKEPANAKTEDNKTEADGSVPEKVLKKPDKILPCPRCNSMNTKFCYYNNYNVNQPRYFCRNCQRYWTAGGTMRNVPVGAGRRKSKHSAPQYHKLVITSDGLQSAQLDTLNLTHHGALLCVASSSSRPLIGNGTVLKFAQEVPLCESMASVLNIREQGKNGESGSMIHGENRDEPSCASSATASNFVENGSSVNAVHVEQSGMQVYSNGLLPLSHLQCCSGAPWAYPRIPAWSNVAAMEASRCSSEYACRPENGNSSLVPWNPKAMMATTPFCAATFPFPFIPAPFWFCTTWPNGTGNVPWVGFNDCMSPSSSTSNSGCSGNGSPTLGKHSRDASLQSEEKMEKSLWVPKTLRIDDPEEATKSSIWTTLGIKPDIGGIFQSNAANKAQKLDSAQVFHANPAAFSRSQSFQEST